MSYCVSNIRVEVANEIFFFFKYHKGKKKKHSIGKEGATLLFTQGKHNHRGFVLLVLMCHDFFQGE